MCTLSLQGGRQGMQCFQNTGINATPQTPSSRILPNTLRNPDSVTTTLFGEIIQMMEKLRFREIKWLTWGLMDVYYRKCSPFASSAPIACSQNLDFSAQASFHFPPKILLFYKEDHKDSAYLQRHMIVCPISRLVFLVTVVRRCVLFGTCSSISLSFVLICRIWTAYNLGAKFVSVLCCNEWCDPGLITLPTLGLSFPHLKNEVGVEASCSLRPLPSSSAILVCVSLDSDSVGALCLDSLLCQADCLVFDLSTLFFYLDQLTFFFVLSYVFMLLVLLVLKLQKQHCSLVIKEEVLFHVAHPCSQL